MVKNSDFDREFTVNASDLGNGAILSRTIRVMTISLPTSVENFYHENIEKVLYHCWGRMHGRNAVLGLWSKFQPYIFIETVCGSCTHLDHKPLRWLRQMKDSNALVLC